MKFENLKRVQDGKTKLEEYNDDFKVEVFREVWAKTARAKKRRLLKK